MKTKKREAGGDVGNNDDAGAGSGIGRLEKSGLRIGRIPRGEVSPGGPVPGPKPIMTQESGDMDEKKKGGKVKRKRKHGGMVPGKEPAARLDKRARGGGIATPKSPLSGASVTEKSFAKGDLKAGSEGRGKDVITRAG